MPACGYEFYLLVSWVSEANEWDIEKNTKIKFISTSGHVIFCLLYKLMTTFLTIFRRFLTTFQKFPKIFQNCSEGQTNVSKHFPRISKNSRRCPKISEDCRRLSRKTRKCFDDTPTNLSTMQETNLMSLNDTTLTKVTYGKYATRVPDEVAYGIYEWFSSQ